MRIIFAGTPEFARVALDALKQAGHEIGLVLTQPDRPAGRGLKLQASPVKQYALDQSIAVAQPRSLRLDGKYPDEAAASQAQIQAAQADVMVVAAYGLILPQWVLNVPRLGCMNIHASLLPRWRGAAPIHRAIQAGDALTGITLMQMDAGLDTGDMLLEQTVPIAVNDTTPSLHDKLALLGGRLILHALDIAQGGQLTRTPQPSEGITYANKIDKSESAVNWQLGAVQIERNIRAFQPSPGCTAMLRGEAIKLCAAQVAHIDYSQNNSTPRSVYAGQAMIMSINPNSIDVQCSAATQDLLRITELQRAGGKRMSAAEFVRGFPLVEGERFE